MQKVTFLALFLITLLFSCRKENMNYDCDSLKEGITANDVDKVKTAMNRFIAGLQSSDYNQSNINKLCQEITTNCGLQVEPLCFDCIKTLPSQTEIRISYNSGGTSITKIVDLSYTAANKMVFHNMHD